MTMTEQPVKKPRTAHIKQNGQTRPADGTLTGYIWAMCDSMTAERVKAENVPEGEQPTALVTQDEVWDDYSKQVENPARATVATQYGRWVAFNGYQARAKAARKAARENMSEKKAAEKQLEKEARAAARKATAERKAKERAEKAAEKEAEAQAKHTPAPDDDVPYATE